MYMKSLYTGYSLRSKQAIYSDGAYHLTGGCFIENIFSKKPKKTCKTFGNIEINYNTHTHTHTHHP